MTNATLRIRPIVSLYGGVLLTLAVATSPVRSQTHGPFSATEQYIEDCATWRSSLLAVAQPGLPNTQGAAFELLAVGAAFDAPTRRPAVPSRVELAFVYRPCHMTQRWTPEAALFADGKCLSTIDLKGHSCVGAPGRWDEYGTAEVTFDTFRQLAAARVIVVRVDGHDVTLTSTVPDAFRWFIDWQVGGHVGSAAAQPN